MVILENIDIDIVIDKAILPNIDIDKILNRFKFGISNRATTRQNQLLELTFDTVQPSPCSILYFSQTNMHDLCFEQPDI